MMEQFGRIFNIEENFLLVDSNLASSPGIKAFKVRVTLRGLNSVISVFAPTKLKHGDFTYFCFQPITSNSSPFFQFSTTAVGSFPSGPYPCGVLLTWNKHKKRIFIWKKYLIHFQNVGCYLKYNEYHLYSSQPIMIF